MLELTAWQMEGLHLLQEAAAGGCGPCQVEVVAVWVPCCLCRAEEAGQEAQRKMKKHPSWPGAAAEGAALVGPGPYNLSWGALEGPTGLRFSRLDRLAAAGAAAAAQPGVLRSFLPAREAGEVPTGLAPLSSLPAAGLPARVRPQALCWPGKAAQAGLGHSG